MVDGDFIVIMSDKMKIRGILMYPNEFDNFEFCINSCELFDINFKGHPFT